MKERKLPKKASVENINRGGNTIEIADVSVFANRTAADGRQLSKGDFRKLAKYIAGYRDWHFVSESN